MTQGIKRWLGLTAAALLLAGCGAQSVDDLMSQADDLREQGRFESAIADYREVLEQEPDNAEARFGVGAAQLRLGDYGRAASSLERARDGGISAERVDPLLARALLWDGQYDAVHRKVDSENLTDASAQAEVLALRGEAHRQEGFEGEARERFRAALEMDENNVTALVGMSRLAAAMERPDDARTFAERAVAADEESPAAWLATANAARLEQRQEEALDAYARGLDLPVTDLSAQEQFNARGQYVQMLLGADRRDDARDEVDTMLRQGSRHPYANYLAGLMAYGDDDLSNAVEHLQTVLSVTQENPPAQTLLAAIRIRQEQYNQAVSLLRDVVSAQPANAQARAMLATAYRGAGQDRRANEVLAEGMRYVGDDSQALAILAQAAGDDVDGVIENLRARAETNPEFRPAQLRFAQALVGRGEFEPAMGMLEQPGIAEGDDEIMRRQFLALAALRSGDTERAVREAESLTGEHPDNSAAYNLAGGIYMALERYEDAGGAFDRARELDPDSAQVAFNQGLLALAEERLDDAVEHLERGLEGSPETFTALMSLAQAERQRGNPEAALAALERAIDAEPDAIQPRVAMAQVHANNDDLDAALSAIDAAVQRAPNNANVLGIQGGLRLQAGQAEAAVESLQAAVAAEPDSAQYRFQLARAQDAAGQNDRAIETLESLVADRPELIQPAVTLGLALFEQNRYDEALSVAENLKQQDGGTGPGNLIQGHALSGKENYAGAAEAYQRAVDEGVRDALGPLVANREEAGMDDPAAPLERWLEENPDDNGSRLALAQWYAERDLFAEAAPHFEHLVEVTDRGNAAMLNNLAYSYLQMEDDRAVETAREAHELAPDNPAIIDTVGWAELKAGNIDRAVELLDRALEGAPDNPQIRYHYAAALAEAGDHQQAREILENLLDETRQFQSAEEAEALLRELG